MLHLPEKFPNTKLISKGRGPVRTHLTGLRVICVTDSTDSMVETDRMIIVK